MMVANTPKIKFKVLSVERSRTPRRREKAEKSVLANHILVLEFTSLFDIPSIIGEP
jgi:hypothetical protein